MAFEAGVYHVGFGGQEAETAQARFHFDNEGPRHRVFLEPFEIADRLVTNAEVLAFVEDGGYERPELWLTEGFALVQENEWREPFYWERPGKTARYHDRDAEGWMTFTLAGMQPLDPHAPAVHLSFFEADAVARWMGARLPTEFEWEAAAQHALAGASPTEAPGLFADSKHFHPAPAHPSGRRAATARPRRASPRSGSFSARSGSGRAAPTARTPATSPRPARSASTTASSCRASSCCAARARPRAGATPARRTATFSTPTPRGSSPASASRAAGSRMLHAGRNV